MATTTPSIDPSAQSEHPFALSEAEKAEFIAKGYLILRGCFSPELAKQMVRQTVVLKDPAPIYRDEFAQHRADLGQLDLREPETWTHARVYLDTRRSLPIQEFSPKLWGALVSLLGSDANIARRTMGEQWIFNADFRPPPAPPLDVEYFGIRQWHIDEPGQYMTLQNRRDAIAMLILWSDVDPGGGGPLYSGESLNSIVSELEDSEGGFDGRGDDWAMRIARDCNDVAEFTGKAGDVLITHAFALHAPQLNFSWRIRVLENPTVRTTEVLNYSTENPAPSPVEACVISRLTRKTVAAPSTKRGFRECAQVLIDCHPDYFLPGKEKWRERVAPDLQARVHDLDRALTISWISRLADQVVEHRVTPLDQLRTSIRIMNEVFVNQLAIHAHLPEEVFADDFAETCWARLFRGFVNCEGQNYALALLLRRLFPRAEMYNTIDPKTGQGDHMLVRVETSEGWALADAWGPNSLFYVNTVDGGALAGIPEYSELELQGDRPDLGSLAREAYEGGEVVDTPFPKAPDRDFADLAGIVREASEPQQQAGWTAYLQARMSHLMGERIEAHDAYAGLLSRRLVGGLTGRVCKVFEERTSKGTILARI